MKKQFLFSAFILCLGVFAVSCEGGEIMDPSPVGLNGVWTVSKVERNEVEDKETDYSAYSFEFKSDLTYQFKTIETTNGSYETAENDTQLILDKGKDIEQKVPMLLNGDILELTFTIPKTYKSEEIIEKYFLVRKN